MFDDREVSMVVAVVVEVAKVFQYRDIVIEVE
jgi:hypothetical protein